jgi:molecular chaperone DnaK (HSP70)
VICTGGDHNLGGKDWDDAVIQYLASQFQQETGLDDDILEDADTSQSLRLAAEKAKKALSVRDKTRIPITYKTKKINLELTKQKFEEITENLLEQTITLTREMLEEAKKKGYETFDEVLLVGGSSRMPQVVQRVKQEFNVEPKVFDPDEAVAKGAALYGWKLSINDKLIERMAKATGKSVKELAATPRDSIPKEIREKAAREIARFHGLTLEAVEHSKKTIKHVCSKSFGVADLQDGSELIHNIIMKNTIVPVKNTILFRTSAANQESVNIRIMENEVSEATVPPENATEICNALLEMPTGLPSNSPIDITFSLNEEGRLDITAFEAVENREVKISVETNSILQGEELEEAKCKSRVLAIDELMTEKPDDERKDTGIEREAYNVLKIVDDELKKFAKGQVLFNSPKEMRVGLTERIVVRISRDLVKGKIEASTSRDLETDITVGLRGRAEPQIEEIKISTVMKAELSGRDFQIDPLSEKEQLIKPTGYTQWEWNVTPLKAGRKDIHLSISVILHIEKQGDRKISHSVMEKEIKVKVNWIYGIKENWKWIVAMMITFIGAIIALLSLLKS